MRTALQHASHAAQDQLRFADAYNGLCCLFLCMNVWEAHVHRCMSLFEGHLPFCMNLWETHFPVCLNLLEAHPPFCMNLWETHFPFV